MCILKIFSLSTLTITIHFAFPFILAHRVQPDILFIYQEYHLNQYFILHFLLLTTFANFTGNNNKSSILMKGGVLNLSHSTLCFYLPVYLHVLLPTPRNDSQQPQIFVVSSLYCLPQIGACPIFPIFLYSDFLCLSQFSGKSLLVQYLLRLEGFILIFDLQLPFQVSKELSDSATR